MKNANEMIELNSRKAHTNTHTNKNACTNVKCKTKTAYADRRLRILGDGRSTGHVVKPKRAFCFYVLDFLIGWML